MESIDELEAKGRLSPDEADLLRLEIRINEVVSDWLSNETDGLLDRITFFP